MENANISVQLLNAILQYLGSRPWVEADALIKGIQQEVDAQSKPPAPPPVEPENG
jgi:hypothetical protein